MNVFRAALSGDFWITGIAIARYIPRGLSYKSKSMGISFFNGGEEARVSAACRESEARFAAASGEPWKSTRCFTISNLACGGSQGLLRSSRRELSDLPEHFSNGFSLTGISEQPVGLRLPTGFKNSACTEI